MSRNLAASIRARLKQHADATKQEFNLTLSFKAACFDENPNVKFRECGSVISLTGLDQVPTLELRV